MEDTKENRPPGMLRPVGSLLAHPRAALAAALCVGVLGAPIAWIKGAPRFASDALVHVAPRYMKNARDDLELELQSNTQYRQFVQQQIQTVRRRDVMTDALRRIEAAGGHWQLDNESEARAVERLASQVHAYSVPDSYLIRIGVEGKRAEGLAVVANAVAQAYLHSARSEALYGADQRLENLRQRLAGVESELERHLARRAEIARSLGVSTFVDTQLNPFDRLYVEAREALAEAKRRRIDAESRLAAYREKGAPDPGVQAPTDLVALDAGLNSLKANLYKRRAELTTTMSGLADSHPAAGAGRDEIAEIDAEVATQARRLASTAQASVRAKLEAAVTLTLRAEAQLAREVEIERQRSSEHAARYNEALEIGVQLARLRKEQDQLLERANFFATEANSPGFVYLASPAATPEFPVGGGRRKLLLALLGAAFAAGLVAPLAIDVLARRLRGPVDARRLLGFELAGWTAAPGVAGALSFNAAQLRRIAARLLREHDRHGTRVYALAGCRHDATTPLAMALANTYAELGVRALMIQVKPGDDPGYRGDRPGLVRALGGEVPLPECVMPGETGLPERIGAGLATGSLPALRRLPALLAPLAPGYDIVLLDTAPLACSPDAELALAAADGVLLVVDAGQDHSRDVRDALAILERIAPASAGAVMTSVDPAVAGGYEAELRAAIDGRPLAVSTRMRAALRSMLNWSVA